MPNKQLHITKADIMEMVMKTVNTIMEAGVYMDKAKINDRNKTIGLTYNQSSGNNKRIFTPTDKLNTDKMEQANGDTYEVPLKGGLICYNITSIKGMKVMQYFKHLWDNKKEKATVDVNDNGKKVSYKLEMLQQEYNAFLNKFQAKVNNVIKYRISQLPKQEFKAVSIYPVPSSSNFNVTMAKEIAKRSIAGLPVQVINPDILKKDLRNLEKDTEFIEKNRDYYNMKLEKHKENDSSIETYVDNDITRLKSIRDAIPIIEKLNVLSKKLMISYNVAYRPSMKQGLPLENKAKNLAKIYAEYFKCYQQLFKMQYVNILTNDVSGFDKNTIASPKKGTKPLSVKRHSDEIWKIVKPYLRGTGCYKCDVQYWDKVLFQIKNLTNSERMGMKNIYNKNIEDADLVQKEMERINGTIFVIFDDNVSGGATLSDVCYQCKQMGIKNIIPLSFGKMDEKWTKGVGVPINIPTDNQGNEKRFNY